MANSVLDTNARKMSNYLGAEIDFTTNYAVHKYINISGGGYSQNVWKRYDAASERRRCQSQ